MKQTAVEWLLNAIETKNGEEFSSYYSEFIEQAKEMEREQNRITENTSDGYHTFKELYDFRKAYNVALFNEWSDRGLVPNPDGSYHSKFHVHKSWRHNDGELCFGGGWFIVVAILPTIGQISNHYEANDWDLFNIPETEKALFKFDGHTSQDVINRLLKYGGNE